MGLIQLVKIVKIIRPILSALALSLILNACSIENEEAETIIEIKTAEHFEASDLEEFYNRAQKCVIGEINEAPKLLELFNSTMIGYGDGSLRYQNPKLVVEMEKCLRKADLENGTSLYLNYLLSARKLARIAQGFAKMKKSAECAFFIRRVLNQQGEMEGYRIAGEVFIEDPTTRDIGANMLKEAAKLGSDSAVHTLSELAFGS